ncbi:hypothetical protein RJ640_024327 [Escallonia rubra]|uniref:Uncharacterized protein n=1 Tax=Escallonia rubra TaxID=112253 RepID=A0AA88UPE8_9ASTE|nr:hypothetical protein RJ640_024327 [Escallonia rubra]
MQGSDDLSFCPSFNSYSSDRLAITAAKVTEELEEGYPQEASIDEDDDFEFSVDASADEIFCDGQIRPIFPIFNRDLIGQDDQHQLRDEVKAVSGGVEAIRIPLRNLFLGEREDNGPPSSSSSSEADELESVPAGTYCVWRPKVAESVESSPSRCKKSSSTGSASKRWKFRDLLRRCNSEGKDSFVFLTPKNKEEKPEGGAKVEHPKERRNTVDKVAGKAKAKGAVGSSAHEVFYVQNRAMKEGDKRKSYLPYRQDLVGFFANVNGLGKAAKAFPPFG